MGNGNVTYKNGALPTGTADRQLNGQRTLAPATEKGSPEKGGPEKGGPGKGGVGKGDSTGLDPAPDSTRLGVSEGRLEFGPEEEDGMRRSPGRRNPAFAAEEGEERETEQSWVVIVQSPAESAQQTAKAQFSTRL